VDFTRQADTRHRTFTNPLVANHNFTLPPGQGIQPKSSNHLKPHASGRLRMDFGTFEANSVDVNRFWKYRYAQRIVVMPQSTLEMTKDLVVAQIQSSGIFPENLYDTIRRIHQNLMALKSREESGSPVAETPQEQPDWRKSITRHSITCLECGATLKQLNGHHLRIHRLSSSRNPPQWVWQLSLRVKPGSET